MRRRVYERDGYRCVRCDWAPPIPTNWDGTALYEFLIIDGKEKVYTLDLDHIHPFSAGGLFVFENLQSLCSSCNAKKGARIGA